MEQMISNFNNEFESSNMSIESIILQLREKDSIIDELKKEVGLLICFI